MLENLKSKFFPGGIGERTGKFVRGAQYSMAAAFLSRLITGVTTILVARLLGPKEFGEANLSLASLLWIQITLFFGLPTALVHYISKSNEAERNRWIAEGIKLMALFMVVTVFIAYLFRSYWAQVLGIPEPFFVLALVWCVCFWPFTLMKSLLNAKGYFGYSALAEISYACLLPVTFYIYLQLGYKSAAYVLALSLPYALVGVLGLLLLRPSLSSAGKSISTKLLTYGGLATLAGVASALFDSTARLVAHQSLDITQVGILSAYQGGSTQMATFLLVVASQVFFPIASRTPDKGVLFKKINRLIWPTFPLQILIFSCGLFLYLMILGSKYPFYKAPWIFFSIASSLVWITGLVVWFSASYGVRGLVVNAFCGLCAGAVNVICCRWAIPRYQLNGSALSYILAYSVWIALFYVPAIQRWLNQGDTLNSVHKQFWRFIRSTQPFNFIFTTSLKATGSFTNFFSDHLPRVGKVTCRLPKGKKFVLNSDGNDFLVNRVYWHGWESYEPETLGVLFRLAERSHGFLDVGAHVGFYTLLAGAANSQCEVFAMEPFPPVYKQLQKNEKLNSMKNVHCFCLAASDKQGSADLFHASGGGLPSNSSLSSKLMNPIYGDVSTVQVSTIPVDLFVKQNNIAHVDLVKIDTEGTEPQVLQGMRDVLEHERPDIICEVLPELETGPQIEALLEPIGYRFYWLSERGPVPMKHISGQEKYWNYLFSVKPEAELKNILNLEFPPCAE